MFKKIGFSLLFLIIYINGYSNGSVNSFYEKVITASASTVGWGSVPSIGGKTFASDCIGFVLYIFYRAGLNLQDAYAEGLRGVDSLYNGLSQRNMIFKDTLPSPGDIIFFNNTYDVNKNGVWDDPLSHLGIVESIGKHNTIYYVHFSNSGVKRDTMNLNYPYTYAMRQSDGELFVINSYLRRDRGEGYPKWRYISSYFFDSFARIPVRAGP